MAKKVTECKLLLLFLLISLTGYRVNAQTDLDAIMMAKDNFCAGPMYGFSQWDHYWEGSTRRANANLGTVSTQNLSVMGNYGILHRVNLLFNLNYVSTNASAGVLHGMRGVQDGSIFLKYLAIEKRTGKMLFSLFPTLGFSFPVGNYSPDFLPLSIGLRSRTGIARLIGDVQYRSFFFTGSASYNYRGNVTLDRESYYTTRLIHSDQVEMPNAMQYQLRTGLRTQRYIAEIIANRSACLGGFDISRNNMPFVSNRMNMTTIGFNGKYNVKKIDGLSFTGGAHQVIAGRNVGQASMFNVGIFYIMRLKRSLF